MKLLGIGLTVALLLAGCKSEQKTEKAIVKVSSAICGECATTIKTAVLKLDGVKAVEVDTKEKLATVEYVLASVKVSDIEDAIAKAGYSANEKQADQEAYEKLPDCCKKE